MKIKTSVQKYINFSNSQQLASWLLKWSPVWIIFLLGLWLLVLKHFGLRWGFVPGDLGDGRFNNYILEHFFLWTKGAVPAASYWDAPFFFPYQSVTAFSDNLLGSAPIYAFFRWMGLTRETALQFWYLLNFPLNYAAAVYVLSRAHLRPLAIAIGAFFFAFGIPMLAQGGHFQLYYRFGVPLACFFLIEFFKQPKLIRLAAVIFWSVWQFYLSVYLGLFLAMLLAALAILLPFLRIVEPKGSFQEWILKWPKKLKQAWFQAHANERIISLLLICSMAVCFLALIFPYYKVSKDYGFFRTWDDVYEMLPIPESFLIADDSIIWGPISALFGKNTEMRYEKQLFPGIAVSVMVIIGLVFQFKSKNRQLAWLYLGGIIILSITTLSFNGVSLYWLLWNIPGMNSLRAVGRIQMVWMWPLAFFCAWVIDEILQRIPNKAAWLSYAGILLLTALLILESDLILQSYYLKDDGIFRITRLENKLSSPLPQEPILAVAYSKNELFYNTEIDAMIFAQELGWATINGYSGNTPATYIRPRTCEDIKTQIKNHVNAIAISGKTEHTYDAIIKRIVPIGFRNCTLE